MKIAILSHMHHPIAEPFEGGTEAHTAMLADALADRGHDVTLFAKAGSVSRASVYPLVPSDFEFIHAASRLVREEQAGFLAEALHHSIEVIESSGFDAVINNSLSALPYSFMRHLPMLSVLHTPPTLRDVNSVISDPDWVPSRQHAYVTVSATNADAWRALLPRVLVVHNGIHLDRWTSDRLPTPRLAVWAARITPEKGLHCAIDAARTAGFDIEFAGPISHPDYFETEIVPRMSAHVRYRGHIPHSQLSDFLASGSVFIASPLWAEPFGLSGVEALASGTPVAAFPSGALPELVAPGAGAIAADLSVAALAGAIRDAAQCDRAFTRRSAARFSFDEMIDRYEEHLHLLVAMERTPSTVTD